MLLVPEKKDRAIVLKHQGFSNREIAKQLDCAIGSVSNWTKHISDLPREVINLTPHVIKYKGAPDIPTHGCIRVQRKNIENGEVAGIPTFIEKFEAISGIEVEKKKNRIYIVSLMCAKAYHNREDFYVVHNPDGPSTDYSVQGLERNPFWTRKNVNKAL